MANASPGAHRQCGGSVAELEMDVLPEVSGGAAIEQKDIKGLVEFVVISVRL